MYLNGLVYCKYLTVSVHVTNKVPLLHFQVEPKKKSLTVAASSDLKQTHCVYKQANAIGENTHHYKIVM